MDNLIRHINDSCDPHFLYSFNFSSLSSSRLPLFKNFRNSLFQLNMPQNLSLSLSCLKKSHQWCSGYLSTEEWMWTNSVSATHPNVIRSSNQIYEKKISWQRSSLCFIYSTKNYLFLSLLFFFFFKKSWFIYFWMFLRFL